MIQKRLFALLCTAALTMTCIAPLHAAAENDTTPAAETGTSQEEMQFFKPGFDWERYGSIECSLRAAEFTEDNRYGGIQATFSDPDVKLNIITNYNGWHPMSSESNFIDTITGPRGVEFEVFRTSPNPEYGFPDEEYWCVAKLSLPFDQTFILSFSDILKDLHKLGLFFGKLQKLESFCAMPAERSVVYETPGEIWMLPEFAQRSPKETEFRRKNVNFDNGYAWEMYQAPDAGSAYLSTNGSDSIEAVWADIPSEGRNLFTVGRVQSQFGLKLGEKERVELYDIRYMYAGQLKTEDNAAVGIVAFLTADNYTQSNPETETEVQIVDAWSGERPLPGTKCDEVIIGGVAYDISKRTVQIDIGAEKKAERTQFWIVRKENLLTDSAEKFRTDTNVTDLLDVLTYYGMKTLNLRTLAADAVVFEGTGTAVITENRTVTTEKEQTEPLSKTDTTADGYFWTHYNSDSSKASELKYDAEGRFTGKWDNAEQVALNCGKLFGTEKPMKDIGTIRYSYAADIKSTGAFYIGISGKMTYPNTEFFICDATNSDIPAYLTPDGTTKIDGTEYAVYKYETDLFYSYHTEELEDDFVRFWFVRKDNFCKKGASECAFENELNITEFLNYIQKQGREFGVIRFIAATSGAMDHASGSISFTKNEISITEPEAPPPAKGIKDYMSPYFKIGKNMLRLDTDYEMNPLAVPDYLVNNFDIASLQYTISPEYILSGTWKPGDPIKFNFGGVDKILKECEEKQLPVVIGPLVSRHYPSAYYKDEDGSFVKPEEMNKRIEAIAKELFITLKNDYPALRLEYVLVTSEIINQYPGAATDPLVTIYGENTADLLKSAFESARKYAPAKSKLYMEEFFYPVKNSMKTVKETAAKLQKDTACIDGIAVSLTATEGTWEAESELFDEAINALAETKLDLILTDVNVFADPAYDDEGRCVTFTEAFKSFIAHASRISAVILSDHDQMLDGSHSLCTVRGLTDAIAAALPGQDISQPVQLAGDVNCDKSVDVSDAVLLARYLAEDQTANITTEGHLNADADGNTKIETDDVICILRKIAKLA